MNKLFNIDQADIIKISAVLTAIPRWVTALLSSEGFVLPENWKPYWIIFSTFSAIGMAVAESFAFSYIFNAYKKEKNNPNSLKIFALALLSAILFTGLLSPSIVASVQNVTLGKILSGWGLWVWSIIVASSTISIVASVGYCQKITNLTGNLPKDKTPIEETSGNISNINLSTSYSKDTESVQQVTKSLVKDWRNLSHDERINISKMSKLEIRQKYTYVDDRTALNWMKNAREYISKLEMEK